jgi:arylsulfatase A-like enzyme
MTPRPRHFVILAAILAVGGFLALREMKEKVNLILMSVDTLRPDHLGCYGYARDTSPSIDRLAREGALFRNAVSQSPWTLPSHASMFTSLYSREHGVVRDDRSLAPRFDTLAEYVKDRGYRTAAFTGGGYMHRRFGLSQGFEVYEDTYADSTGTYQPFLDVHWSAFRGMMLDWLEKNSGEPFFLFIHSYDVHKPYNPPARFVIPWYPECRGEIISFTGHDILVVKEENRQAERIPVASLTPSQRDHVISHYDGEIRQLDEEIGILLRELERLGVLDETIVVLTSDHGEQFLEHGGLGHRNTLFEEEMKVPLIVRIPSMIMAGTAVDEPVGLIDLMPSLLELLGVTHGKLHGRSFLPLLVGHGKNGEIFAEYEEAGLSMVRKGNHKLIAAAGGRPLFLFDLALDPAEQENLRDRDFGKTHELSALLEERLASFGKAEKVEEAPEAPGENEYLRDQLKALGYIEDE